MSGYAPAVHGIVLVVTVDLHDVCAHDPPMPTEIASDLVVCGVVRFPSHTAYVHRFAVFRVDVDVSVDVVMSAFRIKAANNEMSRSFGDAGKRTQWV